MNTRPLVVIIILAGLMFLVNFASICVKVGRQRNEDASIEAVNAVGLILLLASAAIALSVST